MRAYYTDPGFEILKDKDIPDVIKYNADTNEEEIQYLQMKTPMVTHHINADWQLIGAAGV